METKMIINPQHKISEEEQREININKVLNFLKSFALDQYNRGNKKTRQLFPDFKTISENTEIPFETLCTYNYIQFYKLYLLLKIHHEKEIYEFKEKNRIMYDHGYHVVQKLDTEEKIEDFVKLWRNHFIVMMRPQFMPNGWSVDFRIKTKIL